MRKRLEGHLDEDERKKLLESLDKFEDGVQEQLRGDTEQQNDKLKKALEARRNKRRKLQDKINDGKKQALFENYANKAGNKVNGGLDEAGVDDLARKLNLAFDKNEVV